MWKNDLIVNLLDLWLIKKEKKGRIYQTYELTKHDTMESWYLSMIRKKRKKEERRRICRTYELTKHEVLESHGNKGDHIGDFVFSIRVYED